MPRRKSLKQLEAKQRKLQNELAAVEEEIIAAGEAEGMKLGRKVWDWLEKQPDLNLTYDANLYSQHDWDVQRGERYGRDALFTIASEGPLARMINGEYGREGYQVVERFNEFLERLGIYYEMGYSWSLHFYPA